MRKVASCLALCSFFSALAQTPDIRTSIAIPPEAAPYVPTNLKPYFLALMVRNPAYAEKNAEDSQLLFLRHLAFVKEQSQSGLFITAGPITDGAQYFSGMALVRAADISHAQAICNADPEVQAGKVTIRVLRVFLAGLEPVRVKFPDSK
jgi:uncharacterized protein YciI